VTSRGPLDGTLVISLEHAVAAPFATRQLADLGARVIKVERPDVGDFARRYDESVKGLSSYFVWLNRSKESLTLDLKSPSGMDILDRLLVRADVFVHNLAPGAVARLGFGPAVLAERYPRLIECAISGYGETGVWNERRSYDLLVQAEAGLLDITGSPEKSAKAGISVADIAAGMYAYSGVLSALLGRQRDGRPPRVSVSLFEALCEWMGSPMLYAAYSGRSPGRTGPYHATIAPYGPFPTADGEVVVAVQNDREWKRFCAVVLGDASLADDARFERNSARVAHRQALHELIAIAFSGLSTAEVDALLSSATIAHGAVNSIRDFFDHPALASRDRWRTIETPMGSVRSLRPPVDLSGFSPRLGPVPALGQDTDAVLVELGYSKQTIADLRSAGAV
jgi:crotonobetainyl-CoA:carnitine CoA-transferase CaiB-like acyl-CoA transferase